jgi:methionyl-tRNA formyltransferase
MRIVFIGAGEIGVPTLQALLRSSEHKLTGVVTQPDKPAGRAQQIEPPPIKRALASGAPGPPPPWTGSAVASARVLPSIVSILQPAQIRDRQAIEEIRALQPDAIVVMAYGQILPREVLEIPRIACLNLHASLLPRWRGAAPIQAAIAAGDPETGITVMYMAEGLDTGDILLQRRIDILRTDTGGSLHDRLAHIAPDALLEALQMLANGNAPCIPQDNALATYAPKLTRDDGKIDWSEPAEIIERKIRAFNPWPGAFTEIAAPRVRKLKIFSAAIVDLSGKPGEFLRSEKELIVAAGKNALSLNEVQPEGKRRMDAAAFLRGHASILQAAR